MTKSSASGIRSNWATTTNYLFALKWRPHLWAGWEEEAVSGEQLIVCVKPRVGCAVHLEIRTNTLLPKPREFKMSTAKDHCHTYNVHSPPSTSPFTQLIPQSTNRVAIATFWRKFHHDGKISLVWWGWGVHDQPPFTISTIAWNVCPRWDGRYTPLFLIYPYIYSVAVTRTQPEPVFVNVYGAQQSILRNRFCRAL